MNLENVLLRGTRASQPVATDVAEGSLYYVTDEGVLEQSLSGSWVTYSDTGLIANINISAGTTSQNLTNLVFTNLNGVSFGLNGSTISGSVNAISRVNISAGTTSNNLSNFVLSNSNGVSFGLNGSTITASVAAGLANINVSGGTTSNNLTNFVLSNSNNVSFGLNGSTFTATVTVATSLTNINVSAGTTSNNLSALVFSNSNNVTFGLDGSTITASISAAAGGSLNFSAGTTSNNLTALTFANSNGVSFGLDASTVTASYAINVSAGSTSNNLSKITFANSNGVTFGLDASTITASVAAAGGATLSYYENIPLIFAANALPNATNVGICWPVFFQANYSFGMFRQLMSLAPNAATFAGTSVNTTWTYQQTFSYGVTAYTKGAGASSNSLLSFVNTTVGESWSTVVGAGATGSHYSVTFQGTYPRDGNTSSFSSSYACSSAQYVVNTGGLSNFVNVRWMELSYPQSFSAGNYWIGLAHSMTSTQSGAPAAVAGLQSRSYAVGTQLNNQFGVPGDTTPFAYYQWGAGRLNNTSMFNGGFNVSDLSTNASPPPPIFQGLRKA